ncbi:hypothetical protein ACN47E_009349 [Coniothyrium glycines]
MSNSTCPGAAQTHHFSYETLPLRPSEFRLLRILSELKDGLIQCELIIKIVPSGDSNSDRYNALSYEWGPESTQWLLVNGKRFAVRQNLFDFLHTAREKLGSDSRFQQHIWIDAICINQQDVQEREAQVPQMRHIYSKAETVVAWLGLQHSESLAARIGDMSAFEATSLLRVRKAWISQHVKQAAIISEFEGRYGQQLHTDFAHIARNTYWQRMWIIQEILLARNARLMLGPHLLSWTLAALVFTHDTAGDTAASRLASTRTEVLGNASGFSLTYLVAWLGKGECSDELDKVYSVLGLLHNYRAFPVRYSIPKEELFCQMLVGDFQHARKSDNSWRESANEALFWIDGARACLGLSYKQVQEYLRAENESERRETWSDLPVKVGYAVGRVPPLIESFTPLDGGCILCLPKHPPGIFLRYLTNTPFSPSLPAHDAEHRAFIDGFSYDIPHSSAPMIDISQHCVKLPLSVIVSLGQIIQWSKIAIACKQYNVASYVHAADTEQFEQFLKHNAAVLRQDESKRVLWLKLRKAWRGLVG